MPRPVIVCHRWLLWLSVGGCLSHQSFCSDRSESAMYDQLLFMAPFIPSRPIVVCAGRSESFPRDRWFYRSLWLFVAPGNCPQVAVDAVCRTGRSVATGRFRCFSPRAVFSGRRLSPTAKGPRHVCGKRWRLNAASVSVASLNPSNASGHTLSSTGGSAAADAASTISIQPIDLVQRT
jgi:hypothetical protein